MSNNLASRFGDLSLGQLPVLRRKTNLGNKKGSSAATVADARFGGLAFSAWNNTGDSLISEFEVSWTVPPDPPKDKEEYYLFNSLVWAVLDGDGNPASANLRPILRWAEGKWTISSWYIGQNSTSVTVPVPVIAGECITGKITLTKQSDIEYDYKCFFTKSDVEIPGTQMHVYGSVAYTTAIVGFEWDNVATTADFFSSATTAIVASNIVIKTGDTNPAVAWQLNTRQTTGNGGPVAVQVNNASSTVGQLQFSLPS